MHTIRDHISYADIHYIGRGFDTSLREKYPADPEVGVHAMVPTLVDFGTPAVPDSDFIVKAATGAELPDAADPGETVSYVAADDNVSPLDSAMPAPTSVIMADGIAYDVWNISDGAPYGRNIVSVVTHNSSIVAMTILYTGFDYLGRAVSELHTITATGTSKTVTGAKAIYWLLSIDITAAADASGNTLNAGTGKALGFKYALQNKSHVLAAFIGGVQELINVTSNAAVIAADATTATNATGDVRGTIAFNTALDGSKHVYAWMWVQGCGTADGLIGIGQA